MNFRTNLPAFRKFTMSRFGNISSKDFQNKSLRQLVANFRNEYMSNGIDESTMADDPVVQFEIWFEDAVRNKLHEPNVMHLSTATPEGKPSGRVLLLKGFDERGFVFFTNYDSRKGDELQANKYAAMTFLWLELYRQVRIEGTVEKISGIDSDEYFRSRPRDSRIGAVVSSQSKPLNSRRELEEEFRRLESEFKEEEIPRPENWGGYRLIPSSIEFWQGRASRLHDRILYTRDEAEVCWRKQRLYP